MADRGYRGRPQRGERADRQINAGHSRGLDMALSDTEAKIRKLKTERIYAFDQKWKRDKPFHKRYFYKYEIAKWLQLQRCDIDA